MKSRKLSLIFLMERGCSKSDTDEQEPALPENYALMTKVWSNSTQPPSHDELSRLNTGIRRFPQASALVLMGIYFNFNAGLKESARDLAALGAFNAKDPGMRDRLKQALDELTATAPHSK